MLSFFLFLSFCFHFWTLEVGLWTGQIGRVYN